VGREAVVLVMGINASEENPAVSYCTQEICPMSQHPD